MKWYSYLEKWPEDGAVIIQLDKPYKDYYKGDFKDHYCMGMRQYKHFSGVTIETYKEQFQKLGYEPSDFWWCYANEFPFPDNEE